MKAVSITSSRAEIQGVDNGVEYYFGLRNLSSSVGRVNMNRVEALKAVGNHPSPAYAMAALQDPNLSESKEGRTDEEFLKQLGRSDNSLAYVSRPRRRENQ